MAGIEPYEKESNFGMDFNQALPGNIITAEQAVKDRIKITEGDNCAEYYIPSLDKFISVKRSLLHDFDWIYIIDFEDKIAELRKKLANIKEKNAVNSQ